MKLDLEALERKAKAIVFGWWNRIYDAPSPAVTAALIARIRELDAALCDLVQRVESEGSLLSPDLDGVRALLERGAVLA